MYYFEINSKICQKKQSYNFSNKKIYYFSDYSYESHWI